MADDDPENSLPLFWNDIFYRARWPPMTVSDTIPTFVNPPSLAPITVWHRFECVLVVDYLTLRLPC